MLIDDIFALAEAFDTSLFIKDNLKEIVWKKINVRLLPDSKMF